VLEASEPSERLSARVTTDPRDVRLPLAQKILYGAGELVVGIRLSSFGFVLFPFYTDVVLLPPALVGAAMAIGRVWDGLNDPVMGWISDRTRTRFGRRRPYLGTMILPLAAGFMAIWAPPAERSSWEVFLYLAVSLCLFDVFFGFYATPYLALGAELTTDYGERARVVAARAVVHNVGLLLGGGGFFVLVAVLGGGRDGYASAGVVLAVLMIAGGLLAFFGTREPVVDDAPSRATFRALVADLRATMALRSFRIVIIASAVLLLGSSMAQALSLYVFRDAFGAVERVPVVITVYLLAATLAFPFWAAAGARLGKARALQVCLCWSVVSHCATIAIQPTWPFLGTLALITFNGVGVGGYILPVAIVADVFDEDELASGRRREGAFFGVWTLVMKLAAAAGIGIVGVTLPLLGYQPGAERQTDEALWAMKVAWGPGIAVFLVLTLLVVRRFPLTLDRHREIQEALTAPRSRG
jgi:GPH family glycoside/pentoside/hexuronide:cation symporter